MITARIGNRWTEKPYVEVRLSPEEARDWADAIEAMWGRKDLAFKDAKALCDAADEIDSWQKADDDG